MSISKRLLFAAGVIIYLGLARTSGAQTLLRLQALTPGYAQSGHVNIAGVWTASQFVGSGSGLTGVPVYLLVGTFPDSMFDASVCRLDSNDTITGIKTFITTQWFENTTPFTVSFTGKVNNLKVDKLDGVDSAAFFNPTSYTGFFNSTLMSSNVLSLTGTQTISGQKTFSARPSFTAATPMTVVGSGLVTNLNVDLLDGLDSSQFIQTGQPFSLNLSAPGANLIAATNTNTAGKSTAINGTTADGIGVRAVGPTADPNLPDTGWAGMMTGGKGLYTTKVTLGPTQVPYPTAEMTINPNVNGSASISLDGAGQAGISASHSGPLDRGYLDLGGTAGIAFGYGSGASMVTKMFLQDDGNFGIGTTSPTSKLHVVGDVAVVNLNMPTLGSGSVALGSSNGTVSTGTVGNGRFASDPDSFAKVTGGRFSIDANGDMNSTSFSQFSLYTTAVYGNRTAFLYGKGANSAGQLIINNVGPWVNCVDLTASSSSQNNGQIACWASLFDYPAVRANLYIDSNGDGIANATSGTKYFRVPDPDDPTRDFYYACIEGPEAAMYARGTGRLVNGEAHIEFPDHFQKLAASQGITVILQPRGRKSRGLGVENTTPDGCTVYELKGGQGDYEFDWEVKAVRKGYEDYRPVRLRNEE